MPHRTYPVKNHPRIFPGTNSTDISHHRTFTGNSSTKKLAPNISLWKLKPSPPENSIIRKTKNIPPAKICVHWLRFYSPTKIAPNISLWKIKPPPPENSIIRKTKNIPPQKIPPWTFLRQFLFQNTSWLSLPLAACQSCCNFSSVLM